jgi:putative hydrolase of the HAD superfamily
MILNIDNQACVVFDLDDTLFKEVDFLKSAYRHIAERLEKEIGKNIYPEMLELRAAGKSVFDEIKSKYVFEDSIKDIVFEYRFHLPKIELSPGALNLLEAVKCNQSKIGLITDGRSKSQRNKLKALGIEDFFDKILISEEFGSEKPDVRNFQFYMESFEADQYIYIGDNFKKDFVTPNKLGWLTIGLIDDGNNIHPQNLNIEKEYLPQRTISSLTEIKINS